MRTAHIRFHDSEAGTKDHDGANEGDHIIAYCGDDGILDDSESHLHISTISNEKTPAGAGIPSILCECGHPDIGVPEL